MKNLSFGTKLLLVLAGVTIISLSLMVTIISSNVHKSLEDESIKYVNEFTQKSGLEVKNVLDKAIVVTNSMANKYENAIQFNEKLDELGTIEYLKNMLKLNDFLVGIWFSFEQGDILYKPYDGSYDKKFYTKNKGYFEPYVSKDKNGNLTTEGSDEFDINKPWIKEAVETKKLSTSKPYVDYSTNTLMITISKPIILNGKVVGVVGVDLALDFLQESVSKIKLYETGYMALYDNHGYSLGHPKVDFVGKELKNLTKNETILNAFEKASKGEENFYNSVNMTGKESYNYVYPIEFGNTGEYWVFFGIAPVDEYLAKANYVTNFSIIIGIFVLAFIMSIILFSMRILSKNLKLISAGLLDFFAFLNKESNSTKDILINSNDEFGTMAKVINQNISKTKSLLKQDEILIEDVKRVVNEVKSGYLNNKIEKNTDNEKLEELKNNFNSMLEVIQKNVCSDINKVVKVLDSFSKLDFRSKIDNDNGKVAIGINNLANIITNMLVENKSNGITLQESSNFLLSNVDKLNISSNEAAASLEETAAALEEITSNIRNNTQSIAKMSQLANGVTKAVTDGQEMANQTTTAMDEINTQVNLVNEAIGVIDNIAFQTNILSLNAAVEAATAGEAGKGFAVVAQEVRNLATRSAEAAKEIKEIVERATVKANEGKSIATNMIEGYKNLNNNISSTMNLIADIENASKEQLLGIEQINDAVNQLDQQTQQNAMVASQSHDIALGTDEIAKLIVEDANQKEFEGKNEVKAKDIGLKKEVKENIIKSSPKVLTKKIVKKDSKEIDKDSTWESF
ncbi:chemotaxis protein [Aliarcobacter skirrowii]|uniref:Chemotaxis protein n=3 Tax=Aliarcobacter skirrowii TaxID=28200 RepID=A0A2U2BZS4_9BACT|nr:methyl-accepting chemotaxis protein [Aliarcobacter skirrowii]PWE20903.1 chemotaxis protein [Aliarcobacter skirrowii]